MRLAHTNSWYILFMRGRFIFALSQSWNGPTASVTCRWCLHRLLHTEPGGEDALLPGPHLSDLATCFKTSTSADGTPSGWAAPQFHRHRMVSTNFWTLLRQVKWTTWVAKQIWVCLVIKLIHYIINYCLGSFSDSVMKTFDQRLTLYGKFYVLILYKWCVFGLYLSWLLCLSVGFLEKWDQCVINAPRGEFYCSMPLILPPHVRVPLLDTGHHERLKVQ